MNCRRLYLTLVILCIIGFLLPSQSRAQKFADSVKWRIYFTGFDSANPSGHPFAMIGFHTQARYGPPYDTLTSFTDRWRENSTPGDTEREWPPPPPIEDVSFNNIRLPLHANQYHNLHPYTDPAMVDTFKLIWLDGTSQAISTTGHVLAWPSPSVLKYYADSMFVRFLQGPNIWVNVDMQKDSTYSFNPARDTLGDGTPIFTNNLRVIVYHPKRPPLPPDSVISTYPALGAPSIPRTDSLRWQATPTLPGMTIYYRVQLATDRTFKVASLIFQDSLAATARAFTNLLPSRWYYWRIKAFSPFGVGIYKTVIDSFYVGVPLPKINLVSPAKNAVNVSNTPKLVWQRFPFGTMSYRVQISSSSTFTPLLGDSTLTDSSVTFPTALTDCDTVFWRVHGINEAGAGPDTTSSFRVHFAVPGPLTPLRLADGAVDVPPASIRFAWVGRDLCTDSYRFQVATDTNFNNLFVNTLALDTFAIATNFTGLTTYYWRVRAENAAQQGAYTVRRSFTTMLIPPGTPPLVSPANGSAIALSGTLKWNKSTNNPAKYRVELSIDPQVNPPWLLVDSTVTDTIRAFGPLTGCSTYYWHVQAINDSGKSAFSGIFHFTTNQTKPDTVRLISPADGATNQPQMTQLQWAPTGACPTTSYILNVALDAAFSNIVLRETLSVTSKLYGPLISSQTYYWRVYPVNATGVGDSMTRSFRATALTRPDTPSLFQPLNGQGGISLTPILTWDTTARAASWRLQVAYDTGFTLMIINDSTLTTPLKQIGPLLDSTWFYWRVSAKNDSGTSDFSTIYSFYTLGPPTMPYLFKPVNGQLDVPVIPTFYWTLPSGAATFQLQVSRDSLFTNFIYNDSTLTTTTFTLNTWLHGYTKYYWRLRAKNGAGWSAFTPFWWFRTARVGAAIWFFPLAMSETGPQHDTVYFGRHPLATYGIDPSLGELEMPQPPPPGNFDVRFIDVPTRPGLLGQGLRINVLPFIAYAQTDTFRIHFQPGVGTYPMIFSWPVRFIQTICDSMVVVDEFGGSNVHKRMDIDSFAVISNSGISSLLIIEYGVFPTGVRKESHLAPRGFTLSQNYPNPFNPTTQIRFSTDRRAHIELKVFDMLGRETITLVSADFSEGEYSATWDGRNRNGEHMPSGIYFVRMTATALNHNGTTAGSFTSTRKMLMMK